MSDNRPPSVLQRAEAVRCMELPGVQKSILWALAFRAGASWPCCTPAVATLMRDSGYKRTAVKEALKALVAAGHIKRRKRMIGRKRTSDEFRLVTLESLLKEGVARRPPGVARRPLTRNSTGEVNYEDTLSLLESFDVTF